MIGHSLSLPPGLQAEFQEDAHHGPFLALIALEQHQRISLRLLNFFSRRPLLRGTDFPGLLAGMPLQGVFGHQRIEAGFFDAQLFRTLTHIILSFRKIFRPADPRKGFGQLRHSSGFAVGIRSGIPQGDFELKENEILFFL